ncbi:acetyl-CoA carboxylase [Streptomyces sp. SID8379]|uniref:carboxyl transferase domain-containing protein n=1 Tax=unclassified Streptomyces TaxID=2593676 RepID=UPI0005B9130D|nr:MULTISPECIES: carboxyl transferase domain-containing protein [unclassified Streptomyces]MYW65513.1 acetyl-CoA carboxylase [Streptomyces sp. SID8379]
MAIPDPGSFRELPHPPPPTDPNPLDWPDYDAARTRAAARSGATESVTTGTATVDGTPTVLITFTFGYLGGSLGRRTGDRIVAAHEHARRHRLPVVTTVATGGSRMQEGMIALTQLQRVAGQMALTGAAGLPQITVAHDPTTGGGWATLGAGADVTLAVPGAQIGFAGSRVRPPDADPSAYTAEGQLAAGSIDAIVAPAALRTTLGHWLRLLTRPGSGPAAVPHALGRTDLPPTGWAAVRRARDPQRPRARAYLDAYFTDRQDLRGDRAGGTDDGVLCGFGTHGTGTVAYAAQCGTATTPAGYRTAARLIRLAGRLGIPVLTLVDTPGAANGAAAERAGAGPAIAEVFLAVAESPVPVTTLVIGEGGSGGALALAAPDRTWVAPDAYFSVIAPELAAAILKRPPDQAEHTADQLRVRPQDLVDLGVARGIAEAAR